eukprot:5636517-Pyramimonas_sp.AAC.1
MPGYPAVASLAPCVPKPLTCALAMMSAPVLDTLCCADLPVETVGQALDLPSGAIEQNTRVNLLCLARNRAQKGRAGTKAGPALLPSGISLGTSWESSAAAPRLLL